MCNHIEGQWQEFATMNENRDCAAGIVYENTLHIFGGIKYPHSIILSSTEIIHENGTIEASVNLPIPLWLHAIGKG